MTKGTCGVVGVGVDSGDVDCVGVVVVVDSVVGVGVEAGDVVGVDAGGEEVVVAVGVGVGVGALTVTDVTVELIATPVLSVT